MKILSLPSFLSHGRTKFVSYKLFSGQKPSLVNKLTWFSNDVDISTISFTNPNRQCSVTPEIETPLCIKVPSKTRENQGRIYLGDYPSVTTILDGTRPKSNLFALLNWRRRQILDLGKSGFDEKVANIKNNGTSFHEAVKQYLSNGCEPELLESNQGHWKSVADVLTNIERVIALESVVVHPDLHYAGTLDGLVFYQGKLCVIDWKTTEKKRTMLKDCFSYPHQIVAYAGAVNYDPKYVPLQVCHGLLVLAYSDGSPADTLWMSPETCQYYWNEWILRIELYSQLEDPANSVYNHCDQKHGEKLEDLAQFVGGVPVLKQQLTQSEDVPLDVHGPEKSRENELDYGILSSDTSEWFESAIDVFGIDPSVVEFSEECEFHSEDVDLSR